MDLKVAEERLLQAQGTPVEHYWLTRVGELRRLSLVELHRLEELQRPLNQQAS